MLVTPIFMNTDAGPMRATRSGSSKLQSVSTRLASLVRQTVHSAKHGLDCALPHAGKIDNETVHAIQVQHLIKLIISKRANGTGP